MFRPISARCFSVDLSSSLQAEPLTHHGAEIFGHRATGPLRTKGQRRLNRRTGPKADACSLHSVSLQSLDDGTPHNLREVRAALSRFSLVSQVSDTLARLICSRHVPRDEQQAPRYLGRLREAQLQAAAGLPLRASGSPRSPRVACRYHGAPLAQLQHGGLGYAAEVPEMRIEAGAHRAGDRRLACVNLAAAKIGSGPRLGLRSRIAHAAPHQHRRDFHAV